MFLTFKLWVVAPLQLSKVLLPIFDGLTDWMRL